MSSIKEALKEAVQNEKLLEKQAAEIEGLRRKIESLDRENELLVVETAKTKTALRDLKAAHREEVKEIQAQGRKEVGAVREELRTTKAALKQSQKDLLALTTPPKRRGRPPKVQGAAADAVAPVPVVVPTVAVQPTEDALSLPKSYQAKDYGVTQGETPQLSSEPVISAKGNVYDYV